MTRIVLHEDGTCDRYERNWDGSLELVERGVQGRKRKGHMNDDGDLKWLVQRTSGDDIELLAPGFEVTATGVLLFYEYFHSQKRYFVALAPGEWSSVRFIKEE